MGDDPRRDKSRDLSSHSTGGVSSQPTHGGGSGIKFLSIWCSSFARSEAVFGFSGEEMGGGRRRRGERLGGEVAKQVKRIAHSLYYNTLDTRPRCLSLLPRILPPIVLCDTRNQPSTTPTMLSRQTTRSLLRRTTLPSSSLTSTTSSTTTSTYTRSKHTDSNNIINFEAKARVKEFQRRLGTSSKVEASAGSAAQVRLVERDGWGGDGFRGKGCGEADDRFFAFFCSFFCFLFLSLSLYFALHWSPSSLRTHLNIHTPHTFSPFAGFPPIYSPTDPPRALHSNPPSPPPPKKALYLRYKMVDWVLDGTMGWIIRESSLASRMGCSARMGAVRFV